MVGDILRVKRFSGEGFKGVVVEVVGGIVRKVV